MLNTIFCAKILPQLDKSKHGVFPGLGGILFSKFEQVFGNDRVDLIARKISKDVRAIKIDARFELLWHLHPFIGLINFFHVAVVNGSNRCTGA